MPYNLRSSESLKRPGDQLSPCELKRPRKKLPGLLQKSSARHLSELETILNKEVLRPLSLFESLFAAYPIVQSIVRHLPTPDVMVLSITTPVLRRFLKENSAFRVFSNHRDIMNINGPAASYCEFEHLHTYKNFASDLHMTKLLSEYINAESITSLVLDGTDVDFAVVLNVCAFAKNLTLLSLKFCRQMEMPYISMLLESKDRWASFVNTPYNIAGDPLLMNKFLPSVRNLHIWGTPKSQWQYIPSTAAAIPSRGIEQISPYTIASIIEICKRRNIELDVMPCKAATRCVGLDIGNEEYLHRRHKSYFDFDQQLISYNSIWMAEKRGGECKFCAKVTDIEVCEECMGEPRSLYGFCMTCDLFVCDSAECEGMRTACYECGMQCKDCIAELGPKCNTCPQTVCTKHFPDHHGNKKFLCSRCSAAFCDICIEYPYGHMYSCAICKDTVCVDCSSPSHACAKCKDVVCTECVEFYGETTFIPKPKKARTKPEPELDPEEEALFAGISFPGWFCASCLTSLTTRLKLRKSSIKSSEK